MRTAWANGPAPSKVTTCKSATRLDTTYRTLAEALKEGEPIVVEILSRAVLQLGKTIAGFVHMLAPERIVLGGGLVEAMPEFFLKKVKEGMRQWLLPPYRDVCEVVVAKLGDDAGIQGAAAWARHKIRIKT